MAKPDTTEYDRADFNSLYEGGSLIDSAVIREVPWEIGRAQPAVWAVLEVSPRGRLLDVGCGFGRNAAAAYELGFDVVAIDSSPVAVDAARGAFGKLGIEFRVADATKTGLEPGFSFIMDSATYHAIPSVKRHAYLGEMARLLADNGEFHIVTFAPSPEGMPKPLAVELSEIAANAETSGWDVVSVDRVIYKGNARAIQDFISKNGLAIRLDEDGLTCLPCWHVTLTLRTLSSRGSS